MVINNGITICHLYSNTTGVRTVQYPISFQQYCVMATCVHWEQVNYANVCVSNQTLYNFKIWPYPNNLNTLVGVVAIGY